MQGKKVWYILLIWSWCIAVHSSEFTRSEQVHENGDTTVTYEYEKHTQTSSYYFATSFEHYMYDTVEQVSCSNITMGYQSHDSYLDNQTEVQDHRHDHQSEYSYHEDKQAQQNDPSDTSDHPEINHELSDDHQTDQRSDYVWSQADQIRDRGLDHAQYLSEQLADNDYGANYKTDNISQGSGNKRSVLYSWCKGAKEYFVGPSEKTLKEQRDQVIKKLEAQRKYDAQQEEQKIVDKIACAYQNHQEILAAYENSDFLQIMQQRNLPFQDSLETADFYEKIHAVKSETIGFMDYYHLDAHKFLRSYGCAIHHHLTDELIGNLEMFTDLAVSTYQNPMLQSLLKSGVFMTDMAQNYTSQHHLFDAISATNCSHGFVYYLKGMLEPMGMRCKSLATGLAFFSCQLTQYSLAAARGVATGIVTSEISQIVLQGLRSTGSALAPELTQAVMSGCASIVTPITLIAGGLCMTAMLAELGYCGYLYVFDQQLELEKELQRLTTFAEQFYSFDQAPEKHVEHVASLATTLCWPWQRESIFQGLMGLKTAHCQVFIDTKQVVEQSYLVNREQLLHAIEYIKNTDLHRFNAVYEIISGRHFFKFMQADIPEYALIGMQGLIPSAQQQALSHMFFAQQASDSAYRYSQGALSSLASQLFLATDVGAKFAAAIKQTYEEKIFENIAKEYVQLVNRKSPQELFDIFYRCHEISIVPESFSEKFFALHKQYHQVYPGLSEFTEASPYLMMQLRHIFYPSLTPIFTSDYQAIKKINLNGFHHDENWQLEKLGLYRLIDPIYGKVEHGAE